MFFFPWRRRMLHLGPEEDDRLVEQRPPAHVDGWRAAAGDTRAATNTRCRCVRAPPAVAAAVLGEVVRLGQVEPRTGVLGLGVAPLQEADSGEIARHCHHGHVHHQLPDLRNGGVGGEVLDASVVRRIQAGLGVVVRRVDQRRRHAGAPACRRRDALFEVADPFEVRLQPLAVGGAEPLRELRVTFVDRVQDRHLPGAVRRRASEVVEQRLPDRDRIEKRRNRAVRRGALERADVDRVQPSVRPSGPPADRHLQARKRLAPGQAGREHLIDRRPHDVIPAAGLHEARQPPHHAALELFDGEQALIAALEVEASEHEDAVLDGFERREDGRQREVGLAAGRRPFLRDRAPRRVDGEETLRRVWRRGGPCRPPAGHRFQPGERDRDAARSLEHRSPAET